MTTMLEKNERNVDAKFKQLIAKILNEGHLDENPRTVWASDKTSANSIFITQEIITFDTDKGEVPITSLRPIAFKSSNEELLWIYQDQTSDLSVLEARGVNWWENWKMADGTIGQRYGATINRYEMVDKLLQGLKENPFGRRHIMNMWQEKDLSEPGALSPCAYETLWSVRREEGELVLDCTLIQRSSDYLVAGHINALQYHSLQLAFAKHLSYKVGKFTQFIQNVHIYERHLDNAQILLGRQGQQSEPRFYLDVPDGTDFYKIQASDFKLENYEPVKPNLKFELAE